MKGLLFLMAALLCCTSCEQRGSIPTSAPAKKFVPALPDQHQANITPGQSHQYALSLQAGEAVHIQLDQRGVDVALILLSNDTDELLRSDQLTGFSGLEELWFQSELPARYLLNITAAGHREGSYHLTQKRTAQPNAALSARINAFAVSQRTKPTTADLEAALQAWRDTDHSIQTAMAQYHLGERLIGSDRAQGISHLEAAYLTFRSENAPFWAILTANRLGFHYRVDGNPAQAEVILESALDLAQIHHLHWWQAYTAKNTGLLHFYQYHQRRAVTHFRQALLLFEREKDHHQKALTHLHLAQSHILFGRLNDAMDHLNKAHTLWEQLDKPRHQASVLVQQGWIHMRQKSFAMAESLMTQALELKQKHGSIAETAQVKSRLATLYRVQGFHLESETILNDIEQVYEDMNRPDLAAVIRLHHAMNLADQDRFDEIDLSTELAAFQAVGNHEGIAEVHVLNAQKARSNNHLLEALGHMEAALAAMEFVHGPQSDPLFTRPFLSDRFDRHVQTRDLLFKLDQQHPGRGYDKRAFELMESVRAHTLRNSLVHQPHSRDPATQALQKKINQLELQRLKSAETMDPGADDFGPAIRAGLLAQSAAVTNRPMAPPLDLATIRAELLDHQTRLVTYYLSDEQSRVMVIGPNSLVTYPLPARSEIVAQINALMATLVKTYANPMQQDLLNNKLSEMLIAPILGDIAGKRLLIIKDDDMHTLPFAMLRNPNTGKHLIQAHVISDLPSAAAGVHLLRRSARRGPPSHELTVFADPVYGTAPQKLQELSRAFGPASLQELPWTRREAEGIAELVPKAQLLLRHEAAVLRLAQLEGQNHRTMHFAAHGLIHRHEQLSGLILAMEDGQGYETDGFLRIHQLEGMRLPTELTVLSACNTARGKAYRGEGPMGLGRAFHQAGSTRVLMSSWRIQDGQDTVTLMHRFYESLYQQDLSAAQALQHAQVHMIQKEAKPQSWAGFFLSGPFQ